MKEARRTVRKEKKQWGPITQKDPVALSIIIDYAKGDLLSVNKIFADGLQERCEKDENAPPFNKNDHEEIGTQEHTKAIYYKIKGTSKSGFCIRWVDSYCVQRDPKGCDGCS